MSSAAGDVAVPKDAGGRRVVVTGGAGFLGRRVVARLEADGWAVVAPSSSEFDLTDPQAAADMVATHRPDVVIHLAARVGGIGYNMANPAPLYLDNLQMGTNVIEATRTVGAVDLTVLVGTVCSYPKFTPVPFAESALWDGYPEETNAPYGIAKKASLVHAQVNAAQYGQRFAYLIPTNLYGPGDKFHPAVSHVIPALIKKCVEAVERGDEAIDVWGTGAASREYLYVDDAAAAVARAAALGTDRGDVGGGRAAPAADAEPPAADAEPRVEGGPEAGRRAAPSAAVGDGHVEPINLGADREVSIRETVETIARLVGFEGELRWDATKPDGQPRRGVDGRRAREVLGWQPHVPFDVGLQATIDWYLANRDEAERLPAHA